MTQVKETRPKRTSLAERSVMNLNKGKEAGYHYRIVNDTGDRIETFRERGYEVVSDSSITIGDRRVGKPSKDGSPVQVSVGGGMDGYLMRIKDEYYSEDQAYKEQKIAELEGSMKKDSGADYGTIKLSGNPPK
jgi:hypothetical protein